jgi:CheY-like chemotaxis protein
LKNTPLNERQKSDVDRIEAGGERLLRLVKDILDFQKIIMGRLPMEPRDFDLVELAQSVISENQARAVQKGVNLHVESDVPSLKVNADPDRITQALENLVGNSLKFTDAGEVVCRIRREYRGPSSWAIIEVQDTGRGMSPDQQTELFKPFTKILGHSDNPTGTGLGLAITHGVCRAAGGDIRVDASRTAIGKGSTFVIDLPLNSSDVSLAPANGEATTGVKASTSIADRESRVLVIDDDPDAAELLKRFFLEKHFQVCVADSGVRGLENAKLFRPTLITLDIKMPGLDGWQVLKLLKSEPETADIPVVLVTIADDRQRGFAMGAIDYLAKPIDWEKLSALVDRCRQHSYAGRVLVVEDERDQRELVAAELRARGCEVVEAENGRVALERLEDFVPDLIVLDLVMPEMDGFQFLSALRDHSELRDVTVVVLSGKELNEEDHLKLRGQVSEVLEKGDMTWTEIEDELTRLLKGHADQKRSIGRALHEQDISC